MVAEDDYRLRIREDIAAGQHTRIVLQSEKVGNGRQNIDAAAQLIHLDRLHARIVNYQRAFVYPDVAVKLAARKLGHRASAERVGIVVGGDHYDCVLRNASRLKLLHKLFKRVFQLEISGDIRLGLVGIIKFRHGLTVFCGHIVVTEVVIHVSADGHIVGVERRSVNIFAYRRRKHLAVRFRPAVAYLQPVADALVGIAHVRVRPVAVIEIVGVIVIGDAVISERRELIAKHERQIIFGGLRKAPASGLRDQPLAVCVFTVGGGDSPERRIVVIEAEALAAHFVQQRRHLRVYRILREALRRDEHKVFPTEYAGVRVLFSRRLGGKHAVQPAALIVRLILGERVKIDVDHVVFVRGIAPVLLRHRLRLVRRKRPLSRGQALRLEPYRGHDAEIAHREQRNKLIVIDIFRAWRTGIAHPDNTCAKKEHQHREQRASPPRHPDRAAVRAGSAGVYPEPAEEIQRDDGQKRQQQRQPAYEYRLYGDIDKLDDGSSATCGRDRREHRKYFVIYEIDVHADKLRREQHYRDYPVRPWRKERGQRRNEYAERERKYQREQRAPLKKRGEAVNPHLYYKLRPYAHRAYIYEEKPLPPVEAHFFRRAFGRPFRHFRLPRQNKFHNI